MKIKDIGWICESVFNPVQETEAPVFGDTEKEKNATNTTVESKTNTTSTTAENETNATAEDATDETNTTTEKEVDTKLSSGRLKTELTKFFDKNGYDLIYKNPHNKVFKLGHPINFTKRGFKNNLEQIQEALNQSDNYIFNFDIYTSNNIAICKISKL